MKSWLAKLQGAEFRVMRLQDAPTDTDRAVCDNPQNVVDYLKSQLPGSLIFRPDTENLIVVLLSVRLRPIGFEVISNGTLDTLLVHAREVFKPAIVMNAAAIIIAHNHPSGDPTPSEADIRVTHMLIKAGATLQIDVKDHVILGKATPERAKDWSSLRELGYFYS